MKKIFQALALLASFVLLIALPQVAADGVRSALALCGRVILPSLFPFFVCSNLFLLLGYSARLSVRLAGPAAKLLRLPPAAGSVFLLGLLGGYPAGAQAAGTLYARGELSRPDAERALAVCNQAGPSFIFGVLGGAVFKSAAAGAFLYAVQIVSAVLACRLTAKKQTAPARAAAKLPQPESFAAAFSESVRRAGMSAIHICMFITVFSVLSRYFLLAAGRFVPAGALPLVLGALELSAGCAALTDCALALHWKLCIASALLAFGGVSVLAQSRAAVQEQGLTGKLLLPCKALQAAIACTLALVSAPLLHAEDWPAAAFSGAEGPETAGAVSLLLCAVSLLLFRKKYHSNLRGKRV